MGGGGRLNIVGICLSAYACGLILASYLELPLLSVLLPGFLFFGSLLFLRSRRLFVFALLVFSFLIGLLRYPLQVDPDAGSRQLDSLVERSPVRLAGRVLTVHERQNNGLVADLMLESVESVALVAQPRLRLYIRSPGQLLPVGSRVVFRSRVKRTGNFKIPGEFDYIGHLAYQQIWYTAYLADTRGLAIFNTKSTDLMTGIGALRQAGLRVLNDVLPGRQAALLKALLLGEKGALPGELRRQLAAGGVAHLFAISGLHLGLLALLFYALLKYLYSRSRGLLLWQPPKRVLWPPLLLPLFLYLLLTGDALATRRAFYALLIAAVLCLTRRCTDPLRMLFSLAFLFLLFEPLALWQPSFLLSFSGAFGILLWHKPLCNLLRSIPGLIRFPLQLFGISLAAFIATLPATVFFFHLFAPAGLLSNLAAIPLVSFAALPLGLAGLLLFPFVPFAGTLMLQVSARILELVVDLAMQAASVPGFAARSWFLSLPQTLAILLVCLALLAGWQKKRALLLGLPAVLLLSFVPPVAMAPELILFSVGQGESMLLRTEGKNILIDAGGLRSDSFDVGERLLAPALGRLGVQTLDAIILTHNHPDHSGGLEYIIGHFRVREFWSTAKLNDLRPGLRQILQQEEVPTHAYVVPGWNSVHLGGLQNTSLFVAPLQVAGENDRSLCLYLPTSAGGVLLTGDLETPGVEALLTSRLPGPVGLLKAPHHGSANSEPAKLIRQLRPEVVVVSAGYDNAYHFPSRQLLDQAAEQEIPVWRTDLGGSIRLRVDGELWRVNQWAKGLFH